MDRDRVVHPRFDQGSGTALGRKVPPWVLPWALPDAIELAFELYGEPVIRYAFGCTREDVTEEAALFACLPF